VTRGGDKKPLTKETRLENGPRLQGLLRRLWRLATMADNPDTRPKEGAVIPVSDTPHAPFIFYEGAPRQSVALGGANAGG
jgi:hypothetical protein